MNGLPETTQYATISELEEKLTKELDHFRRSLGAPLGNRTAQDVEALRVRYTGRQSPLQDFLKSLKNLPPDNRKQAGALINGLKKTIEEEMAAFLNVWQEAAEAKALAQDPYDLSLPLEPVGVGSRHPVAAIQSLLLEPLKRMGFSWVDGPEVDQDLFNFEKLNVPADHPAREMQDSFFLGLDWVMRTQTSNVQAHVMEERGVPLRIVSPGFVYRNEYDMTHVPTFRQFECLVVDKGVHFGHLRHTLDVFLREVFGRPVKTRLRSSFFPFTEPSAELDIECQQCFGQGCRSCKGTGWLEMGGCGLVNPEVLKRCGVDANEYSGFAFGFGLDRLAMGRFSVADLRSLFEGDESFLRSFHLL